MRCAVVGCNSDNQSKKNPLDKSVKFHRFPKNSGLCKQWLRASKRQNKVNIKTAAICSKHFLASDYKVNLRHQLLNYTPKRYRGLKDDAIPTQNLPQSRFVSLPSISAQQRRLRAEKKQRAQFISEILAAHETVEPVEQMHEIVDDGGDDTNGGNILVEDCSPSDKGVQTDERIENLDDLRTKVESQNKEIEELKNQLAVVKKVFTKNQIKKLNNHKKINWSVNEISNAIAMYAAGPKAYRLSLKKGFPHPAVSTMKKWLKKMQFNQGILKNVLKIAKCADMCKCDRICTITFNKIKIRKEYVYDQVKDCVLPPYSYVQVAMISGIFKAWKQPIFFDFDCKMTSSVIREIIKYVEDCRFHVVAMVLDLGGANTGLHKDLNISKSKPYFQNPATNEKIFVLADVPHLLKLIRNNFVDHGFSIGDRVIKKEIVEQTINCTNLSDLKIPHKMTIEVLNCHGPQRQIVKFAAKLFSHTMSCAISRCGTLGFLSDDNWVECAEFFKLVNDWFDVFNVSTPMRDTRARNRAYGLAVKDQNIILDRMSEVISQMKVIGSRGQLPFQKGILISNCALKMLLEDLKRRFGAEFVLTRHLNQDVLENFFGVIRAKSSLHDHPTPEEFKYRLKSYILGINQGAYSDFSNVEKDDTPDVPLSGSLISKLNILLSPPSDEFVND